MKYGFIFDFDGTVADSGDGIVSAVLEVYKGNGMPAPSKEFLHRQIGLPAQDCGEFLQTFSGLHF